MIALLLLACVQGPNFKNPMDTIDTSEISDSGDSIIPSCDGDGDGFCLDEGDCDDANILVYPGATEVCNGVDDNCDGSIDEGVLLTFYTDSDGDGYGSVLNLVKACSLYVGIVDNALDCDDSDATVNPDAEELCDPFNVDEDCNGLSDNSDTSALGKITYYIDFDGDGYGSSDSTLASCEGPPSGYVVDSEDCNDSISGIHPGASEVCDAVNVDEDCDGLSDDADIGGALGETSFYIDSDGDGYGGPTSTLYCDLPLVGYTSTFTDCNDSNASIHPGAMEVCDLGSVDEDCNGLSDDSDPSVTGRTIYYIDRDGDSYGDIDSPVSLCHPGFSQVLSSTDCNDSNPNVYPSAVETCNDVDDSCDGFVDEGLPLYYSDADNDSYGAGVGTCFSDSSLVGNNLDCNDINDQVYPGAAEYCDGQQNNCNTPWTSSSEDRLVSYVSSSGVWSNVPYATLNLESSGTYYFCAGTYSTQIVGNNDSVDLIGVYGASLTTIRSNSGSVLSITEGSIYLEGFTVTGGTGTVFRSTTYGGGIYVTAVSSPSSPTMTMVDCVVDSNVAQSGGGVAVMDHAWVSIESSLIRNNEASGWGGGGLYAYLDANLEVTDSQVSENFTSFGSGVGGGIYSIQGYGTGGLILTNTEVDTNTSGQYGGGIHARQLELNSSSVYDNLSDYGGGIYIDGYDTVFILDSQIYQNTADEAGGIFFGSGAANVEDSQIYMNSAQTAGGFVLFYGSVTMTDTSVYENSSYMGGGAYLSDVGILYLDCPTTGGIYSNSATYEGGGVWLVLTTGTLTSVSCDWGTGATNNSLYDVSGASSYPDYSSFGSNASFVCNATSCR